MKKTFYEIRDEHDGYVCSRATAAACRRLLERNVTYPPNLYWNEGPYSVRKVTTEHKFTFRPSQRQSDGPEKGNGT